MAVLIEKVNAGDRLGEAFLAARFSPFECHLVVAGEKSAQLDTVFEHLSEFWKREQEMRQALVRSLIYPLIVLHLAIVVGALIETATANWQIALTHFVMQMATLYAFGFVIYTLVRVSWSSEIMRRFWLAIPLIGGALKSAYAYRWISAMKLEFNAGITLSRAVGDAWARIRLPRLRETGRGRRTRHARGGGAVEAHAPLETTATRLGRFYRDGEVSGALDRAFTKLEEEAARNWSLAQQRLTEWLPKIVYFLVLLIARGAGFSDSLSSGGDASYQCRKRPSITR